MTTLADTHIYFLDDEPTIREVVKETLEDSHFKVSCFDDPIECLARLRFDNCDLLITDLKMPEKDGIEISKEVHRITPWIPVLMITGYGDIPTAVKAMKTGAVDFIEKPLDKKDFVQKIKSILIENKSTYPEIDRTLTRTEKKVLKLVMNGMSNMEIANLLNRSVRTIEVHRANFMHKFGVDNIVDLIKRVAAMGLVDLNGNQPPEEDRAVSEDNDQFNS